MTAAVLPARLVIRGEVVHVGGGLIGETFVERSDLRLGPPDARPRRRLERLGFAVAHTTQGIAIDALEPGSGPDVGRDRFVVGMWRRDRRTAGAHVVVDFDGSIVCCADLATDCTMHAGTVNGSSWGLEVCQRPRSMGATVYQAQIASAARVLDVAARALELPRTIPIVGARDLDERRDSGDVALRFVATRAAQLPRGVGLWSHSNVSLNRGPGDPGPWIARHLVNVWGWSTVRID